MKVADLQLEANLCVRERDRASWRYLLFFVCILALIKLDLPIDMKVHLNVRIHISRPRVKYGGFEGII